MDQYDAHQMQYLISGASSSTLTVMFKKPLSNLKTTAPLRSSDRKKLKQRVVAAFKLTPEDGDNLVPEGVLSIKFSSYSDEPGTAYLDVDGNPIWFTIGKGSDCLIPTIYTLWKKQDLLPFVTTPSEVVPILVGGADLMIPGVIHCSSSLVANQLVAIRQHMTKDGKSAVSPPLVVGRMALPSVEIRSAGKKGKAVLVIHTWKDHLWDMGSKQHVPEDTILTTSNGEMNEQNAKSPLPSAGDTVDGSAAPLAPEPTSESSSVSGPSEPSRSINYTPQEVTELLHMALLQAISENLSSLPSSAFPMPATILYSNFLLPSRPAFPTRILAPADFVPDVSSANDPRPIETEITIKTSSQKSPTAFLKAAEKRGLLTLKTPQKQQPDVLVTSVNASHPSVQSHESFVTIRNLELKAAKKAAREEKEKGVQGNREVQVKELYKPHQSTVDLFEEIGASKGDLYTSTQVSQLLNEYIKTNNLVNQNEQAYVNLDGLLQICVSPRGKAKGKTDADGSKPLQFMRRDELVKTILQSMQSWYEVRADGRDVATKKGTISPIQVVTKSRQGRKACTLITGFEPFLVVDAQEMADDLRKSCASATSVAPTPGKAPGSGLEVLIQGKQSTVVIDYLHSKGIQKKWIEVSDLLGKK